MAQLKKSLKTQLTALAIIGVCVPAIVMFTIAGRERSAASKDANTGRDGKWRSLGLHAGDSHRYALELRASFEAASGTVLDYTLHGAYQLVVLRSDRDGTLLSATLGDAQLTAAKPDNAQTTLLRERAPAELAQPLTFRLSADGVLQRVTDDAALLVQARTIMRTAAAAFQVVRPDEQNPEWTVQEHDGTGAYQVRYAQRGLRNLRKTKLHYIARDAATDATTHGGITVDKSQTDVELDPQGLPLRICAKETLRATGSALAGVASHSEYCLEWKSSDHLSETQLRAALDDAHEPKVVPNVYAEAIATAPDAAPATPEPPIHNTGPDVADLLADLQRMPLDESGYSQIDQATLRQTQLALVALIRQDDRAVDDILAAIARDPRWAAFLWETLGKAGTPAAQRGLRTLIEQPHWSAEERLTQLIALSTLEDPTPETVTFLAAQAMTTEQRTQAIFALGTAAHNLAERDPERAGAIVRNLNAMLEQARDATTSAEILKALGNSGHPDALDGISPQLDSTNPQLRIAALDALRFMRPPSVDDRIARALRRDRDASVRLAATLVAGWRAPSDSLVTALVATWKHDPSADVRDGARAALRELDGRQPGLLDGLHESGL